VERWLAGPDDAGRHLRRLGGDEVRELLDRLGYQPTGQVLPVDNEVYRPLDRG
jgi:hypothetical protein